MSSKTKTAVASLQATAICREAEKAIRERDPLVMEIGEAPATMSIPDGSWIS